MKTALKVLAAIASILTVLMAGFGLSSSPADKRTAVYFMILAVGAWDAYILLLLRSQHIRTHDIFPASRGQQESLGTPHQRIRQQASSPPPDLRETRPALEPQDSAATEPRPVYGPPNPRTPVNNIPFPSGPGDLWMEYTQDVFYGVIWRWHYKPEIDNTPRGLRAYCPECESSMPLQEYRPRNIKTVGRGVYLQCGYHSSVKHECENDDYAHIKKLIQEKIADGTWLEVVNKQRMAMGLSPYSPDIVGRRPRLEEIKEQILIALAKHSRCRAI